MESVSGDAGSYFLNLYSQSSERPRWLPKDIVLVEVRANGRSVSIDGITFSPLLLVAEDGSLFRLTGVARGSDSDPLELFDSPPETFNLYMNHRFKGSDLLLRAGVDQSSALMTPLDLDQTNSAFLIGDRIFAKYYRKVSSWNREAYYYENMADSRAITPYFGKLLDSNGLVESLMTGRLNDPKSIFALTVDAILNGDWDDVSQKVKSVGVALGEVHGAIADISSGSSDLSMWYSNRCMARGDRLSQGEVAVDLGDSKYVIGVDGVIEYLSKYLSPGPSHGDFHLGQCLLDGDSVVVIDFEGEPVGESQNPFDSPYRDVSGALRSLSYLIGVAKGPEAIGETTEIVAQMRREFLLGYTSTPAGNEAILGDVAIAALAFFEFEKACYELLYERTFRPRWIEIPASSVRMVGESLAGWSKWSASRSIADRIETIANFY